MPEGDTIRRLADAIRTRFVGERVERSIFRHPRLATESFAGQVLTETASHGKHLFLRFDDLRSVHVHLLMQGSVEVGGRRPAASTGRRRDEEWRRRFEFWFPSGPLIGVDIPLLHVVPTVDESAFTAELGPDLCGDDFDAERDVGIGVERMLRQPDQPLGAALLDQHHLAGFGNIYAVETPFLFGVSPFRPVGTIEGLTELVTAGAALIRTNAERGPQNTTGRRLETGDQWILPSSRRGCRVCASRLERWREQRVPWQRRTVCCPVCQDESNDAADPARAERLLRLHPAHRRMQWDG